MVLWMNAPIGATKSEGLFEIPSPTPMVDQVVDDILIGALEVNRPRGEGVAAPVQSGDPIAASPPSPPERVVELMGALEESVADARARRKATANEHKHTPMRAGMPVPMCPCGAIRGLDNIWRLETKPELDTPDSQEEEW